GRSLRPAEAAGSTALVPGGRERRAQAGAACLPAGDPADEGAGENAVGPARSAALRAARRSQGVRSDRSHGREVTGPAALFALAAAGVALALQISSGLYDEHALALVSLATMAALIAAFWRRRQAAPEDPRTAQAILGAGSAVGLACHLFTNPTFYADPRAFQGGFRWLALIALVLLSAYLSPHLRASLIRARFLLLLACFAVMVIAVIRASPLPRIDVGVLERATAAALLRGRNPYSIS